MQTDRFLADTIDQRQQIILDETAGSVMRLVLRLAFYEPMAVVYIRCPVSCRELLNRLAAAENVSANRFAIHGLLSGQEHELARRLAERELSAETAPIDPNSQLATKTIAQDCG